MDIENDLSRLLDAGAEQIHVPVQTIVAEAAARGRRLRTRRRITRAVGAVAAVALLTGGVAAFGPDGARRDRAPAAGTTSASAPSVLGPTDPPVNGRVATTGAGLLGALASLLPASTRFSSFDGSATPAVASMRVDVDFGDHQPSSVYVQLEKEGRTGDVCPKPPTPLSIACQDLPGGARLYAEYLPLSPTSSYVVRVKRQDGSVLELILFNGQTHPADSGLPMTRTRSQPPQTQAFWFDVAKSPLWDFRMPVDIARDGAARASAAQR